MTIIESFSYLILGLAIVGFVVWAVNSSPYIDAWFKKIICGLICIVTLIVVVRFALHGFHWRLV